MAKAAESFVCQSCGAAYRKWQGRCDACGGWNTIAEEAPKLAVPKGLSAGKGKVRLHVPRREEPLAGDAVRRRLQRLAESMNLTPEIAADL